MVSPYSYRYVQAAKKYIAKNYSGAILIKGGHLVSDATDLLFYKGEKIWFKTKKIENSNTHGTGCTLSSAIACNLADGMRVWESVKFAKLLNSTDRQS